MLHLASAAEPIFLSFSVAFTKPTFQRILLLAVGTIVAMGTSLDRAGHLGQTPLHLAALGSAGAGGAVPAGGTQPRREAAAIGEWNWSAEPHSGTRAARDWCRSAGCSPMTSKALIGTITSMRQIRICPRPKSSVGSRPAGPSRRPSRRCGRTWGSRQPDNT